jgi:type I restriction enzyme, S subunit
VKKLRELILQLAVRGKLVRQDPVDEPATVLLEKISFAKKSLLNSKRRQASDLEAIAEEELFFKVPIEWQWARFGEISDIVGGVTKGRNLVGKETDLELQTFNELILI